MIPAVHNIRIEVIHHGSPVRLTLAHGDTLTYRWSERHEEGWSAEQTEWSHERPGIVVERWDHTGRDCDGWTERHGARYWMNGEWYEGYGPETFSIEKGHGATYDTGRWTVYGHGYYEGSSVLAGQERRRFVEDFDTLDEARAAYPDAEVWPDGASSYTPFTGITGRDAAL